MLTDKEVGICRIPAYTLHNTTALYFTPTSERYVPVPFRFTHHNCSLLLALFTETGRILFTSMYAYSILVHDLNVCCLHFSCNSRHIDSALHPCALRSIQYSSICLFWFLRSLFNLGGNIHSSGKMQRVLLVWVVLKL